MKESPRIGVRFSRLVVVERVDPGKNSSTSVYLCRCDCGGSKLAKWNNLKKGSTKSCGCLYEENMTRLLGMAVARENRKSAAVAKKDAARVSGFHASRHPLYNTYRKMLKRCYNTESHNYRYYGGKGVRVFGEWHDGGRETLEGFRAFVLSMGDKPTPEHMLDRIDALGDYAPNNCRWADRITQRSNTRQGVPARTATVNGETKLLGDWCRKFGLDYERVMAHMKKHTLSPEEAVVYTHLNRKSWLRKATWEYENNMILAKRAVAAGALGPQPPFPKKSGVKIRPL